MMCKFMEEKNVYTLGDSDQSVAFLLRTQKKRFTFVNIIFATVALTIEQAGISLRMYFYADTPLRVFDVPLMIIGGWIVIGHTSWAVYRKFGWTAGLLTGIIIDLPLEFLAFHLGWWTWIPSWTPAIFFDAPALNFLVYLSVSLGSILIYKYATKSRGDKA
jgi:hypothetical protein